jgi:WD40 repeat protein
VEVPVEVIEAVASPQLVATLNGHEDGIWQVAWAPDGRRLASLGITKGEVKLWHVAERKTRDEWCFLSKGATLSSDIGNSYSLAFTPDGRTLLVGHYKPDAKTGPTGGIALWDVATGQRKGLLQHTPSHGVARFALSPDGKTIAASESWGTKGDYKRSLTLWDIASGTAQDRSGTEYTNALTFAPGGKVLAQAVYTIKDNRLDRVEVRRRDLTTNKELPALPNTASKNPINCLAFSPDGQTLAGADYEGTIILWDTASAKVRTTPKPEDRRRIAALAFAPDGKTLAAAAGDRVGRDHEPGLVVLYDAATGQRRSVLTGHTNAVLSVAFSPDGKLLASGGADRTVRLWDMIAPAATNGASGGR